MKKQPSTGLNLLLSLTSAFAIPHETSLHRSRGKGKGTGQKARRSKHMDNIRAAKKTRNIAKRK